MSDWVVETPSFEEDLMNNRVIMLNQNGVNRVVEIIKEKDKEIEELNNIINELEKWLNFFNENGLVIDLGEGKQTTVMPTLAILEKIQELKGSD